MRLPLVLLLRERYMQTAELHRMNFLDHGRKGMTYASMLKVMAAWFIVLAVFYSFSVYRVYSIQNDILEVKAGTEALNVQKEGSLKQIQQISRKRVGASSKQGYSSLVQNRPVWSKVVGAITGSLPPQVWLDSIHVVKDEQGGERLEIKGRAKSQRALTNFIMKIDASPIFSGTALVHTNLSEKSKGELSYEMTTIPQTSGI